MKIFSAAQIKDLDQYTIQHEPIDSIDLMERAAEALFAEIVSRYKIEDVHFSILAGPGNNGGDALALASLLKKRGFDLHLTLYYTDKLSAECDVNRQRFQKHYPDFFVSHATFYPPVYQKNTVFIDGLFGTGLHKPLSGIFAELVFWLNNLHFPVISIDVPSGLRAEENDLSDSMKVRATFTLTLQFPKLSFFMSENDVFVGDYKVLPIGLHPEGIECIDTKFQLLEIKQIASLIKSRNRFSHKGSFGHALLIAGKKGMAGASVLASKSALRTGAGLVTVYGPECNRCIVQTAIPEVIFLSDENQEKISRLPDLLSYSAIAVGPGIGTHHTTVNMLDEFLSTVKVPLVLDADAINILSLEKELMRKVPQNSILTPHPGEFDRLFGKSSGSFERFSVARQVAVECQIYIVLKGANTQIITPEGKACFNSTGNPGMATAGSGDVLTGIIVSLLAQKYTAEEACMAGVFLHGLAGDLALHHETVETLIASDIIDYIKNAFLTLNIYKTI